MYIFVQQMGVAHYACEQCNEIFDNSGDCLETVLIRGYKKYLHSLILCHNCYPELDKLLGPKDGNGEQALTSEFLEWEKKRAQAKIKKLQEELAYMETLKPPTVRDLLEEEDKEEEEKQNKNKNKRKASDEEEDEPETKKTKSA